MSNTNKNLRSLFNAVSAISLTLVNGLLGIIVTRMIIDHYGSDFNGLNSTVNQITNILLVLEGGFTLASNVALFAPMASGDYDAINFVLKVTYNKFHKIGKLFFIAGILSAVVYASLVKTSLSKELVITIVMMAIIPAAVNLYYAATYRVLLQSDQSEYIISLVGIGTIGIGHLVNMLVVYFDNPMWCVRFVTMIFSLINSALIVAYVSKKYKYIDLSMIDNIKKENAVIIRGTNDVIAQKITGIIYNSAPIIFLSISPSGGTVMASVYMVYNSVFLILKSLLLGVIDAPRFSIGQIIAERDSNAVWKVFSQYECIAFSAIFVAISTAYALIMPFIVLYTDSVADVNYYRPVIANIMAATTAIEMMHIPSGHLINMSGNFKVAKNIQVCSSIVLLLAMPIGGKLYGVYGMLLAVLITALLLALLEMCFVHFYYFKLKLMELMRLLFPLILVGILLCRFEYKITIGINTVSTFVLYAIGLSLVNLIISIFINYIFCRKEFFLIISRMRTLFD